RDWSSDVCSSDLGEGAVGQPSDCWGAGSEGDRFATFRKWPKHVRDPECNCPLTWAFRVFYHPYEGGACVKRGRKPVAELRSSFGTSILAVGAGRSAVSGAPRVSWFPFGPGQDVLRPLRAAG